MVNVGIIPFTVNFAAMTHFVQLHAPGSLTLRSRSQLSKIGFPLEFLRSESVVQDFTPANLFSKARSSGVVPRKAVSANVTNAARQNTVLAVIVWRKVAA
jgi:hypothetical protein